ncbi:hypothetical protein [Streptomyces sp. NPDC002276]
MSGSSHRFTIMAARGGRKLQYVCSCGARGWETNSYSSAQQMGNQHVARRKAR